MSDTTNYVISPETGLAPPLPGFSQERLGPKRPENVSLVALGLLAYAVGNLVEMLGDVFLARGIGWLLGRLQLGRFGVSGYRISWERILEPSTHEYYIKFSDDVREQLGNPAASGSEAVFRELFRKF